MLITHERIDYLDMAPTSNEGQKDGIDAKFSKQASNTILATTYQIKSRLKPTTKQAKN
jgi:hypothetical protein